jgi:hemerythrin
MSVGVAALDADHERIIAALNNLVEAHDRHQPTAQIEQLFGDLMDVIEGHFAREERLMTECRYDGLDYHRSEHGRIRERLLVIREHELHAEEAEVRAEVREFLTNWLYGHVLVDDFAYRGCMSGQRDVVEHVLADGGDPAT